MTKSVMPKTNFRTTILRFEIWNMYWHLTVYTRTRLTESDTLWKRSLRWSIFWSWICDESNAYRPPLSLPSRTTILETWSLTRQKLGWNSKNTLLSLANLDTLNKFFVILGTWRRWFKDRSWEAKGEENYERPMFNRESHTIANMNLLIAMIWCVLNQIISICNHMVRGTRVWIPIGITNVFWCSH